MSLVEDFMNTRMVSRGAKATVLEIAKTMAERKISSVAVTDDNNKKVLGILTERDIVKTLAKGAPLSATSEETIVPSVESTSFLV